MPVSLVKKLVLVSLAAILVVVWIRNYFLFVPVAPSEQSPSVTNELRNQAVIATRFEVDSSHTSRAAIRDPFSRPSRPQSSPTNTRISLQLSTPLETIRASLLGHVINSKLPYVVALDSSTGTSRLYRTGDSLNGFVLKSISRSEIIWKSSKGRKVVWKTQ